MIWRVAPVDTAACTIAIPKALSRLPTPARPLARKQASLPRRCVPCCTSAGNNGSTAGPSERPDTRTASQQGARPISPPSQEGDTATVELRRETFAGRVAILALGAMLLGERLTGRGIVATLNHKSGIPLWEMEPLLAVGVLGLLVVALYPSHTPLLKPGLKGPSVWKGAQRLVGRVACLIMAGTIATEVVTGKGALKLFNIETGKEALDEAEIAIAFFALLFLTASPPDSLEDA